MRRTLLLSLVVGSLLLLPAGPASGQDSQTCFGKPVTVDIGAGDEPTDGPDVILGSPDSDVIDGLGGNDRICGKGGDDVLIGGGGNDRLHGGGGDDELDGGTGRDRLFGGLGADLVAGGPGLDQCNKIVGADDLIECVDVVARIPEALALATMPDSADLLVASQDGRIWRTSPKGESWTKPSVVLDLQDRLVSGGERGLLGLAVAPDAGHLYAMVTTSSRSEIREYRLVNGKPRINSERVVVAVPEPRPNHNGGALVFGPDGYLYAGFGDGGGSDDPEGNGQDPFTLSGTIIRIDPSGEADNDYTVPDDNPFADGEDGAPEVWAWGLRNPWRFSFDAANGDLWIGDVGQNDFEEVNQLVAGSGDINFGWAEVEGNGGGPDFVDPAFAYVTGNRCSVIGGYVYRGDVSADLAGEYVWGDFCEGEVRATQLDSSGAPVGTRKLQIPLREIVSFGTDRDGELYVLGDGLIARIA